MSTNTCLNCIDDVGCVMRVCCDPAMCVCVDEKKSNRSLAKLCAVILLICGLAIGLLLVIDKHGECGKGDNDFRCIKKPTLVGFLPDFELEGKESNMDVDCKYPTKCSLSNEDNTVHSVLTQTSQSSFFRYTDFALTFPTLTDTSATCRLDTLHSTVKCQVIENKVNTTSYEVGSQWSRMVSKDGTQIGKITTITLGCKLTGLLTNQPCDRMCISDSSNELDRLIIYNMEIMLKIPTTPYLRGGNLISTGMNSSNSSSTSESFQSAETVIAVE